MLTKYSNNGRFITFSEPILMSEPKNPPYDCFFCLIVKLRNLLRMNEYTDILSSKMVIRTIKIKRDSLTDELYGDNFSNTEYVECNSVYHNQK
ncbi:hypothetical protein A3Q56_07579 [Intoshia linei]|uniref:Uncharacterized protein n=1 Tax=Intoshia linei TaxID=1819745 RepID=A0A177ASB0_9BILA|nr:hypothetical protein A3Q56_07579 [Intoshia linei]